MPGTVIFGVVLVSACLFVVSLSQRIPALNDPFPPNPGPEPGPTTLTPFRGCPAECSKRFDEAMRIVDDLEQKLRNLNITVSSRLNGISVGVGTGTGSASSSPELPKRVQNLEVYLPGNISSVTNKLTNDLTDAKGILQTDISEARRYIDNRINQLQRNPTLGSGGGNGRPDVVYGNITARLDLLEYDKVQTLIDENNVWRKNFEVVNKTFSKMRKSSYGNDVIVVG